MSEEKNPIAAPKEAPVRVIPKIWTLTWKECLVLYGKGTPIVSFEGFLIASRDRKITGETKKKCRELYQSSLALAFRAGKEIPEHVMESEPGLFDRLKKSAA